MLNLNACIVCGSTDNLETELTIKVDDERIAVKVCDEHADDLTPKRAKELYEEKQHEIKKFIEQAKALGLEVSIPAAGNKIATAKSDETKRPEELKRDKSVQKRQYAPEIADSDDVLPTDVVDNVMQNRVVGVSGSAGHKQVERHEAYTPEAVLESKLPDGARQGKVKMGVAEGREGQLIAIPEVRQDGTGTTRIQITKGGTDRELQRRFKDHASTADADGCNVHSFGAAGYAVHPCTMCKGEGTIRKSKTEVIKCPRCGGSGMFGTA